MALTADGLKKASKIIQHGNLPTDYMVYAVDTGNHVWTQRWSFTATDTLELFTSGGTSWYGNTKTKQKGCTHIPQRGFRPHVAKNCIACRKEKELKLQQEEEYKLKQQEAKRRIKYKVWDCYHMIDDNDKIIKEYCNKCKCRHV